MLPSLLFICLCFFIIALAKYIKIAASKKKRTSLGRTDEPNDIVMVLRIIFVIAPIERGCGR